MRRHWKYEGLICCENSGAGGTDCELHLLALVLDMEGPPALHPLVLEEGHVWHRVVILQHGQSALFGGLGTTREAVQVKG